MLGGDPEGGGGSVSVQEVREVGGGSVVEGFAERIPMKLCLKS